MWCEKCFKANRPLKGNRFVVFGSTSQSLLAKIAHHDGLAGFTPHIITLIQPVKYKEGKIELIECCGVCEAGYEYKNKSIIFFFKQSRHLYLSKEDFNALFMKWVRTGYEII
jgi:hypothetical protein